MTTLRDIAEYPARLIVSTVAGVARRRIAAALMGLALTLILATAYVIFDALNVNPVRSGYAVRIVLAESGGLLPNQDVTLRGVPIGRVTAVNLTGRTVTAVARIDSDVQIPKDTAVRVSALTAAGEQYLDFRPATDRGPFLADGSTIGEHQSTVPVAFSQLLDHAEGALNQIDPNTAATIMRELRMGPEGPGKLAAIVDGGTFLINTLDSVLPQTISTIRNSRTMLTTIADTRNGLHNTLVDLANVLHGVNALDGGFRRLVDTGRKPLAQLDGLIADNSDAMVQLLGNMTTISQLSYVRVPALKALFPTTRDSMLDSVASIARNGGLWALVDPYPRYSCDYNLPRQPPSQADSPEPYLYTYCTNPDPAVLIRGARNAPRPPGDDTAGPPPGVNPLAKTDPTPKGPLTIPQPYGGPPLPYEPPN